MGEPRKYGSRAQHATRIFGAFSQTAKFKINNLDDDMNKIENHLDKINLLAIINSKD
jgi:hypothetical protein